MADRDDLKFNERLPRELKPAAPAATGEDPLMELVRIMSGESIVDPTPATGGETVPVIGAVGSDAAPANDLETKLLTDLDALSSAFYLHPLPAPPAKPATPPPKPAATASPPQPQIAASAAPMPAAPQVAASPLAYAEKPDLGPERPAIAAPLRSGKRAQAVSLLRDKQAPGASSAGGPPFVRPLASAPGNPAKEKPGLADVLLQPTTEAPPVATDTAAARPRGDRENRAAKSPAAFHTSRLASTADRPPLFGPKAAEPQKNELPKVVPSDGSALAEERAVPPESLDAPGLYAEDDGEPPPLADEIEDFSKFGPRRDLLVGGALLAVVLATGVTYAMVQTEKSVAMRSIIAADPAKIVPTTTPAYTEQQKKLIHDRVDAAKSADQMKLVTPGNEKAAEVPASSVDGNNPISRVIEPAGPGFDPPAKASDVPASANRPATDLAAGSDSGQVSPKKARALLVGPYVPVVGGKTASDDGAGKLSPGPTPPVPPSAPPAANGGAADAHSYAPAGQTQLDAVINGKGLPIPINLDPLAINRGGDRAAAGAVPSRGRTPEPVGVSVGDASRAALMSDDGAAAADDASAAPAAPATPARVPIPPTKPPTVFPKKAGKMLPTPPAVASSGDLY